MTFNLLQKLSVVTVSTAAIGFSLIAASPAQAGNLVKNGGFETGDFTDWSLTSNGSGGCDSDWNINSTGTTGCFPNLAPATEGTFAAYNSFDGDGPQEFRLEQSFTITENITSATLNWSDTAVWDLLTYGASIDRHFRVDLFTDNDVFNVFDLKFEAGTQSQYDWTARSVDVTPFLQAHLGEEVTLAFYNQIPQFFSGPAGLGLDDISLEVTTQPVPEPGTLAALSLVGLAGLITKKKQSSTSEK